MQSPIHIKRWQTSASVLCYSGLLFDVESLESYALDLIVTDIWNARDSRGKWEKRLGGIVHEWRAEDLHSLSLML